MMPLTVKMAFTQKNFYLLPTTECSRRW